MVAEPARVGLLVTLWFKWCLLTVNDANSKMIKSFIIAKMTAVLSKQSLTLINTTIYVCDDICHDLISYFKLISIINILWPQIPCIFLKTLKLKIYSPSIFSMGHLDLFQFMVLFDNVWRPSKTFICDCDASRRISTSSSLLYWLVMKREESLRDLLKSKPM